jgi:hypothetical protein
MHFLDAVKYMPHGFVCWLQFLRYHWALDEMRRWPKADHIA